MQKCENCRGKETSAKNKLDKEDMLMSRKEAANYIGFKAGTLAVWDCTGRFDLKPVKLGNRVRYRKSVLDAFLLQGMQP